MRARDRLGLALLVAAVLAVSGCSLRATFRPETHVVQRGDTLYGIAWQYGLDWRNLARWNGLESPYTIYPGQRLSLDRYGPVPDSGGTRSASAGASSGTAASASEPAERQTSQSRRQPERQQTASRSPPSAAESAAQSSRAARERRWQWPAAGQVLRRYSGSRHGIDIGGASGDPVRATGGGKVVYSGSGLKGYGKLVIIKHDERYLSAYGYNSRLLVEQGAEVGAGDQIAEMGVGPEQQAAVHFEIRRDGQPLDPARILPER